MAINRNYVSRWSIGIIAGILSTSVFASPVCDDINRELEPFAAGDGSKAEPYLICTAHQFNTIGTQYADKHFIIGNDLDFASYDGRYRFFTMIGDANIPFTGMMNGQGHALNNIQLNTLEALKGGKKIGVFRHTQGATIKNLSVQINIATQDGVGAQIETGGLIGYGERTLVDNVKMQIDMRGANYAGGLAGRLKSSQINNVEVAGNIRLSFGNDGVGGIVGVMENTFIEAAKANLTIQGKNDSSLSDIGGLVGLMAHNSQLCNAYYEGMININTASAGEPFEVQRVGGLVGALSFSKLKSVYFNGKIDPDDVKTSPTVVATMNDIGSSGVLWNITREPHTQAAIGEGVTGANLKNVKFMKSKGYNPAIWQFKKGTFPVLRKVTLFDLECGNPDLMPH